VKILSSSQTIYLEEITSDWALESIQPQWHKLWQRCQRTGPFQTPAWLWNWWKHFAPGNILTLAIHHDSRLVGLAPFYVENEGGTKVVKFIGTGITDYNDILAEDEFEEDVVEIIYEYLITHQRLWEKCDLSDISPRSVLVESLSDYVEIDMGKLHVCPFIDLSLGRQSVLGYMEAVHRRKLFKSVRMLESLGKIEFEKADLGDVDEWMEEFFLLHNASRAMRNLAGGMECEKLRAFHLCAARELAEQELLGLFRLTVGGRTAAIIYGFIVKGVFYSYMGGFEPDFAKFSPGNVALLYVLEHCMKSGIRTFDFLRGDEKYKFLWGSQKGHNYKLRMN